MNRPCKLILVFFAILLFTSLTANTDNQTSKVFSIVTKTADYMDIRFKLDSYQMTQEMSQGKEYTHILHPEAGYLMEKGLPELPTFSTTIAIPVGATISFNTTTQSEKNLTGYTPFPFQGNEKDAQAGQFAINTNYYKGNNSFPQNLVQSSEPSVLRDYRIVTVTLNPFSYNPSGNELKVKEDVIIRVNFGNQGDNTTFKVNNTISKSFERIYEATILNYDNVRDENPVYQKRTLLMIYPNNTAIIDAVTQLAEWKKEKGFDVTVVSTQVTGTTTGAIKAYIQNAYNTWQNKPEYIMLVGDATGTFTVPCINHNYGYYEGDGDYPYTHLAGGDYLGDAFIGRLSFDSAIQLQTIVNKIKSYEKTPNMANTGWYNKALLVGDTSPSGNSVISTNRYIKELMLAQNSNFTFTEQYQQNSSPTVNNTAINNGCLFFNYRGWIGMSGWGTSQVSQLTNVNMLTNFVLITCGTGAYAYSGDVSVIEAVLRAGTPTTPKGGIAGIGMSTSHTHTNLNNTLDGGAFHGLYADKMRTMGEALLYAKLFLLQVYGGSNLAMANDFAHWCNLMGDPSLDVWVDVPKQMNAVYPQNIYSGTNNVSFQLTDGEGLPLKDAWVSLYRQDAGSIASDYTNDNGYLNLNITPDLAGQITVTITKPDYVPVIGTIIIDAVGTVGIESVVLDDDNTGGTQGNSNTFFNPGETVDIQTVVKNFNTSSVSNVAGTLHCTDTYVTVVDSLADFGTIAPSATVTQAFRISISNACPDRRMLNFELTLTDNTNTWHSTFSREVKGGDLDLTAMTVLDNGNGVLDPTETAPIVFYIINNGQVDLSDINAKLISRSAMLQVQDSLASFGFVPMGGQVECTVNNFIVSSMAQCIPGMQLDADLIFYNASGYEEIEQIKINIGQVTVTDPLGPDTYGYICYDQEDSFYLDHPEYEWIETVPALGGQGTHLAITDPGENNDGVGLVNLPFTFTFYGQEYNSMSVCSNGWLSFVPTSQIEFRNVRIPGPLCPRAMIAAFWDDLQIQGTNSGIYSYYNTTDHYFVIQWNAMKNLAGNNPTETFEIILYDPQYYPTSLGDGQIKIQYKTFNNVDQENYCSVGIMDHTAQKGIEYTFDNDYPVAARTLTNQSALLFTGAPINHELAYIILGGSQIFFDGNGNNIIESGETVNAGIPLSNIGQATATDITATLTSLDTYVTITNPTATYADITSGLTETNTSYYTFNIAENCPNDHVVAFVLTVHSGADTWERRFSVTVKKPTLTMGTMMVNDSQGNSDGIPDPGETVNLVVSLKNNTLMDINNVTMEMTSTNTNITLQTPTAEFGLIPAQSSIQAVIPATISSSCPLNTVIQLSINAAGDNSSNLMQNLTLGVGMAPDFLEEHFAQMPPQNWSIDQHQENWTASNSQSSGGVTPEAKFLYLPSFNDGSRLITKNLNLVGTSDPVLSFKQRVFKRNSDSAIGVASRSNNGPWHILWSIIPTEHINPMTQTIPLNVNTDINQPNYQLCWFIESNSETINLWYIDDAIITASFGNTARISGHVNLSAVDLPVENVLITAGDYSTHPNSAGDYTLYLPANTYPLLTASCKYFNTQSVTDITLAQGQDSTGVNFNLTYLKPVANLSRLSVTPEHLETIGWTYTPPQSKDTRTALICFNIYKQKDSGIFMKIDTTSAHTYSEILLPGNLYRYYVTAQYDDGESSASNFLLIDPTDTVSVNDHNNPLTTTLKGNYPNPFNPTTNLSFSLAKTTNVKLSIYNIKGQRVKNLLDEQRLAGNHVIQWNGRNDAGKAVSSGIYFIRMETPEYSSMRKALLLK